MLEYAGGDLLYVPVHALDRVTRYTGGSPDSAPWHKLGTEQWARARRRAAERVRDVAAELLDLYSRRAAREGRPIAFDENAYRAFEAAFPFEETIDQHEAIEAVLADMRSGKPMDRVVCGDVGFGKTEVALRAAFAAVAGGRQVAVLVPTTLLAQQHAQTFADRFADWPVRVENLSRFRTGPEQRAVVEGLKAGTVDIVIGTHRLLQRDVSFHDLGLVVVDEEHRFGVGHKERLKQMRADVDMLTLTATPIPRTLNMALGGLARPVADDDAAGGARRHRDLRRRMERRAGARGLPARDPPRRPGLLRAQHGRGHRGVSRSGFAAWCRKRRSASATARCASATSSS